jgi:hypothetical protein
LPVALPDCRVVLIVDGRWPTTCIPTAPTPEACRGPDRLCYATAPANFTPLGDVAFPWLPATPTWSGDDPSTAALRAALTRIRSMADCVDAADVVRATRGIGWVGAWQGPRAGWLVIYLDAMSVGASLEVRLDGDYRGQVIDLDSGRVIADVAVARSGKQPSVVGLPEVGVGHALIVLARDAQLRIRR